MRLDEKIAQGLERLSDVFKTLLWQKAKEHGLSPIQIQILLFISDHHIEICNVSDLAREFNLTKATISDAVRVLVNKGLLEKDYSPMDNRRYNLLITSMGKQMARNLSEFSMPIMEELVQLSDQEQTQLFDSITKLIYQLNQKGILQVQRTCFNCRHYEGDREMRHRCNLLDRQLKGEDIRLDCPEFMG